MRTLALVWTLAMLAWPIPIQADWVDAVFPERRHDFGTVARGSKLRWSFPIINRSGQEVRIIDWKTKCGCTDIKVGAKVIPAGTQTTVEATLDTTKFQGHKASGLTLVLDRPTRTEVELDMTCFIRTEVTLSPGVADFGTIGRRGPASLALTLTYAGNRPGWAVDRMSTIDDSVQARLEKPVRSTSGALQSRLTVTLDPKNLDDGYFKDQITLFTNDPDAPEIPISVAARIQSSVTVAPSIVTFGNLRPGQTVRKTVLVRASRPFRITGVSAQNGLLSADLPDTAQLVHTLSVTLQAPDQPGSLHDVLEIQTDLAGEPPVKFSSFATVIR